MAHLQNINDYKSNITGRANLLAHLQETDVDDVIRDIMYYAEDIQIVLSQPGNTIEIVRVRLENILSIGPPNEYAFLAKVSNTNGTPNDPSNWDYHDFAAAPWPPFYEDVNAQFRAGNPITPDQP